MRVIVDADACPRSCLESVLRLSRSAGLRVTTVANFNHEIESDDHIVVGGEPQAADIKIANITAAGDVVVTQDTGLAALVMARGAAAIHPCGTIFREDKMDEALEEREIKAKFRRAGGRTRGPLKRTAEDDERFEGNFSRLISAAS